eukprot:Nitzschia sp. Nitz4//scaffold77_size91520//70206//74185//NITZ4_004902-RA/size91520-augustus-gene-0.67-mRNA-1//1//CDS//3329558027//647//frame0
MEESDLLAALGSRVENTSQYEQNVLQNAELDQAPKLLRQQLQERVWGFPRLDSLTPSGRPISHLPQLQSILTKVRKDLVQQPHNRSLLLKQQMLLHLIHTATGDPLLSVRPQEELRHEQVRRRKFQRINQAETTKASKKIQSISNAEVPTLGKKKSSKQQQLQESIEEDLAAQRLDQIKRQALPSSSTSTPLRRRVGIQKRKQVNGEGEETNEELEERKQFYRNLRAEREERRKLRKAKQRQARKRDTTKDVLTGETEWDGDKEPEVTVVAPPPKPPPPPKTVSVTCPLCQQELLVPPNGSLVQDTILSEHMSQCEQSASGSPSRRTRSSLRRRATNKVISYADHDDGDDMVYEEEPAVMPAATNEEETKDPTIYPGPLPTDFEEDPMEEELETIAPISPIRHKPQPLDDWDEELYEERVDDWIENGIASMKVMKERDSQEAPPGEAVYEGGLAVPAWINNRLFPYQRTGLQWMWELHRQLAGGIIGDEMGLGKTVQICAYLGSMASSRKLKSVLIIVPATVLQHWLKELTTWSPGLRRILIHQSADTGDWGGGSSKRTISVRLLRELDQWLKECRRHRLFEAIDEEDLKTRDPDSFCGTGYAVVTTFENVRRSPDIWTQHSWSYVVMDEAQKIRNPDADVTLVCKRLRTPHRIALSGTPIQNDLRELWSLFDFVFPGRLGTLPAFENEFADPIKRGGYSNASPMQVQLAYRCALVLRDLIQPYLLRRLKKDIKEVNRMPGKKEQVLFCRLSDRQRTMYESFLQSDQVKQVLRGSGQMLGAVTMLRKICNHPDLVCPPDEQSLSTFMQQGYFNDEDLTAGLSDDVDDSVVDEEKSLAERSGKLEVLAKILPLWKKQGHRVLIFCQWRKMLNIIERFTRMQGWKFGRLDGNTNVAARQRLVDNFNSDESYYGMLMTTRTGGVGLNLTGADRIILYDPDWNPQTDAQARERAWRFGQEREVTIYRLIVAGTIEEKIYQRQIFKTALSNRVLQDPRQRRLFSQKDLRDLFSLKVDGGSLASGGDGLTETGQLTKGEGYVNPDESEDEKDATNADDGETLQSVLQSKGLAGIFDHGVMESNNPLRKRGSVQEMEKKAKEVARAAVSALKESVAGQSAFQPTWTGAEESTQGRFGPSNAGIFQRDSQLPSTAGVRMAPNGGAQLSSGSLLASIKQRKAEIVQSGEQSSQSTSTAKEYTELLKRIRDFVRRQEPTTEEILDEFSGVKSYDAAVFRRLLKSVAFVKGGRWLLKA